MLLLAIVLVSILLIALEDVVFFAWREPILYIEGSDAHFTRHVKIKLVFVEVRLSQVEVGIT